MMPQYHIVVSLLLASIFFYFTHSLLVALLCFIPGIFIDADKLLDFWIYKKRIMWLGKKTIEEEFLNEDQSFYDKWERIPAFLHSLELLIPLWVWAYFSNSYLFALALTAGFLSHIILDILDYGVKPIAYFLSYRLIHGFDIRYIAGKKCKWKGQRI